jgi:hypothetical protein
MPDALALEYNRQGKIQVCFFISWIPSMSAKLLSGTGVSKVLGVWPSCARSIGPGTSRTAQYSGRLFLHVVSFIVCHTSIRRCAERQSEGLVKGLDVCCRPRGELKGGPRGLASAHWGLSAV